MQTQHQASGSSRGQPKPHSRGLRAAKTLVATPSGRARVPYQTLDTLRAALRGDYDLLPDILRNSWRGIHVRPYILKVAPRPNTPDPTMGKTRMGRSRLMRSFAMTENLFRLVRREPSPVRAAIRLTIPVGTFANWDNAKPRFQRMCRGARPAWSCSRTSRPDRKHRTRFNQGRPDPRRCRQPRPDYSGAPHARAIDRI